MMFDPLLDAITTILFNADTLFIIFSSNVGMAIDRASAVLYFVAISHKFPIIEKAPVITKLGVGLLKVDFSVCEKFDFEV